MACQVDVCSAEGITATFDFDQWIHENGFTEIKNLFIKHQLNKYETLSLTSPQYIQFMSDPQLLQTKSHFIPKLLNALQSLNNQNHNPIAAPSNRSVNECQIIVISEKEQSVLDTLKQRLVDLAAIDTNKLNIKYSQSVQRQQNERDKQIETAQRTVKDTFKIIKDALCEREMWLLNELDKIKTEDTQELKIDHDTFSDIKCIIKTQTEKTNKNLKLCDEAVITYNNQNRDKRKEIILNAGQQCEREFIIQMQNIANNEKMAKQFISQNDNYHANIMCNLNQPSWKKLLENVHNLGAIEVNDENSDINVAENTSEMQLDLLEKNNELNVQQEKPNATQIENKSEVVNIFEEKYRTLQSQLIHTLTFTRATPVRWYKEQKEQCIPVKIIDTMPMKCVILNFTGQIKTNCEQLVSFSPGNEMSSPEIISCVDTLRNSYERCADLINWEFENFDHWGKKDDDILVNGNTIRKKGKGYRSIFGAEICKSPYKYHWKLKQITGTIAFDCYFGVEQNGKEIINDYFCKSMTGYALSAYYGQLYAKDKWGVKYGKPSYQTGSLIDIYLDLQNNTLSYGVNQEKFGKAYDITPGEYRLAVTIRGDRVLDLVTSTQYT